MIKTHRKLLFEGVKERKANWKNGEHKRYLEFNLNSIQ